MHEFVPGLPKHKVKSSSRYLHIYPYSSLINLFIKTHDSVFKHVQPHNEFTPNPKVIKMGRNVWFSTLIIFETVHLYEVVRLKLFNLIDSFNEWMNIARETFEFSNFEFTLFEVDLWSKVLFSTTWLRWFPIPKIHVFHDFFFFFLWNEVFNYSNTLKPNLSYLFLILFKLKYHLSTYIQVRIHLVQVISHRPVLLTYPTVPYPSTRTAFHLSLMESLKTLGILRETSSPWEARVPLTPSYVKELIEQGVKVIV